MVWPQRSDEMNGIPIKARDVPVLHGMAKIRPFSLDEYHRMIETGIVGEDDHYELIEGYLVAKDQGRGPAMGHGEPHAASVENINALFFQACAPVYAVRSQLPITLPAEDGTGVGSEPEPDGIVAEGPRGRYRDHHPGPAEIRLLAEVADSSLNYDRTFKATLYARAGIVLYWIVNLVNRQLEVYSDPDAATGQYRSEEVFAEDQQVVLTWPGLAPVTFSVRDLLP
jgi:Uma2 family endonuclease